MTAITQRTFPAVLAATKINRRIRLRRKFRRRKFTALVATIAKRLCFALAASAPVIVFARFNSNRVGRTLGDFGSSHGGFRYGGLDADYTGN